MDLLKVTQSKTYPELFVNKYTRKVFYDNLWNTDKTLVESRGRVKDIDGNVVINPFTKIFNRLENDVDISPSEDCLWVRKINGFMAAATYVGRYDQVIISTTGSLDSEYVKIARGYIKNDMQGMIREYLRGTTLLFEVVDPSDPHIIEEEPGIYLIGMRDINDNSPYKSSVILEELLDIIAIFLSSEVTVMRPSWGVAKFSDILQESKNDTSEGVVVYGLESGTVLKLKSKLRCLPERKAFSP